MTNKRIMDYFWAESVWLPPNTTWADIAPDALPKIKHANSKHLFIPIPMAFFMLVVRYFCETYWFQPIGKYLGVKQKTKKKISQNPILENAYKQGVDKLDGLIKQLDLTEHQIKRWLRLRRKLDSPSKLKRFCETAWRFLFYLSIFTYGFVVLWKKPWFWDIYSCWTDYPHQNLTMDIWYYYMLSLTFYWSLCFSQFFDIKHKDFWQMFVHHITTVLLMSFSFICNFYRIGTLVLIVHDCSDIFLEAAKLAKYTKYQTLCNYLFGIFTIVWIVMRMGVYPLWILKTTVYDPPSAGVVFPAYYIFNSLLITLLVLNVYWTYLILTILVNSLKDGKTKGDIRSSSSESSVSCSENDCLDNGTEQILKLEQDFLKRLKKVEINNTM